MNQAAKNSKAIYASCPKRCASALSLSLFLSLFLKQSIITLPTTYLSFSSPSEQWVRRRFLGEQLALHHRPSWHNPLNVQLSLPNLSPLCSLACWEKKRREQIRTAKTASRLPTKRAAISKSLRAAGCPNAAPRLPAVSTLRQRTLCDAFAFPYAY